MATLPKEAMIDSDVASSSSDGIDGADPEGWEDVDGEDTSETFVSLFDDQKFDSVTSMFEYCKTKYHFDIWHIQKEHDLDFLGLVKLVNFVRKRVSQGDGIAEEPVKSSFDNDLYLMPTMESDAVLYNLEDILMQARTSARSQVEELQEQMVALQARFDAYRNDVSNYLGDKFENVLTDPTTKEKQTTSNTNGDTKAEDDADYFHSYSFNAIHETMLKDKIRTDAYRDFIYDNKDIFKDKVVLDVGCGTGILSMFCAKAGAKQVLAVDNSNILHTAREIIRTNGLDDKILCIKGKMEEVTLPVDKVDIIVSEWMGYCLLYESMLDSVIYARDKYLAPDGLMVPSHASLEVGALSGSDLRDSCVDFWNEVYGFNMRPMVGRTHSECLIKVCEDFELTGSAARFSLLDLHKVTVADLEFKAPFELVTASTSGKLDGFVLWFDMFFTRSSMTDCSNLTVGDAGKRGITAFSTGPHSKSTHWQQGVCFTERSELDLAGHPIHGHISFKKRARDARALNIKIDWEIGNTKTHSQSWYID